MNCSDARGEFVSLLYGELDEASRASLERHLDSCSSCRDECDANRRTLKLLDRWDAPTTLSSGARREPPIARRRRFVTPVLVGVAAAILAFVGLTVFAADARIERGRVTLSWRMPGAATPDDDRELVDRDQLERTLIPIVSAIVDVDRRSTEGSMAVMRELEKRRRDDLERCESALRAVLRESAVNATATRRALDDVVLWTASYPPRAVDDAAGK